MNIGKPINNPVRKVRSIEETLRGLLCRLIKTRVWDLPRVSIFELVNDSVGIK